MSKSVTVRYEATTVVVKPRSKVSVSASGPQGPVGPEGQKGDPGPQGPRGPAGGELFVYDRSGVPASVWPIAHNLGRMVHVSVFGDDRRQVIADVEQPDVDHVVVTFGAPFSGLAVVG